MSSDNNPNSLISSTEHVTTQSSILTSNVITNTNSSLMNVEYEEVGPRYSESYLAKCDSYQKDKIRNNKSNSNSLNELHSQNIDNDRIAPYRDFVEEDDKEAENTLIPVRFCQPESPTVLNPESVDTIIQITDASPTPPSSSSFGKGSNVFSSFNETKTSINKSTVELIASKDSPVISNSTNHENNTLISITKSITAASTTTTTSPIITTSTNIASSTSSNTTTNTCIVPNSHGHLTKTSEILNEIKSIPTPISTTSININSINTITNKSQTPTQSPRPKTSGWAKLFATTLQRSKSAVNSEMIQKNVKTRPNRKSEQNNSPVALISNPTISETDQADSVSMKLEMRKKKRSLGVDMREKLNFFRKPAPDSGSSITSSSTSTMSGFSNRISMASPNFMTNLNNVWKSTGGPPTREQVISWNQSFENLLHDQHGISIFFEFLRSEFSDENLEFWAECQAYRSIDCPVLLQKKATQIFEDYVAEQSPREINIDSVTRLQTSSDIEHATSTTFDQSQKKIQALMEKDSYQRFLRSEIYHSLLEQYELLTQQQQHQHQQNINHHSSQPVTTNTSTITSTTSSTLTDQTSVSTVNKVSYIPGLLPRVPAVSRTWNIRTNNPHLINTMCATTDIGPLNSNSVSLSKSDQGCQHRSAPSSPKNEPQVPNSKLTN